MPITDPTVAVRVVVGCRRFVPTAPRRWTVAARHRGMDLAVAALAARGRGAGPRPAALSPVTDPVGVAARRPAPPRAPSPISGRRSVGGSSVRGRTRASDASIPGGACIKRTQRRRPMEQASILRHRMPQTWSRSVGEALHRRSRQAIWHQTLRRMRKSPPHRLTRSRCVHRMHGPTSRTSWCRPRAARASIPTAMVGIGRAALHSNEHGRPVSRLHP